MLSSNVLVIAEHKDGKLDSLARSLIFKGRIFANKLEGKLVALVLGENLDTVIAELEGTGVDIIVAVVDPLLVHPEAGHVVKVVEKVAAEIPLQVVLLSHSHLGVEVGPALSSIWPSTFISNCSEVEIGEGGWFCVRSLYEGLINIRLNISRDRPVVVSMQLLSLKKGQNDDHTKPRLIKYTIEDCGFEKTSVTKILEIIEPLTDGLDLSKSQLIIGVGRGIQSPDNLKPIFNWANSLGGAVACSRPLVDLGWLPSGHLVGLSGATVTPKIYIALGISGSAQHLHGMLGSEVIIAVNKNPLAPIFNYAHYGLVADLSEIIPLLNTTDKL